jgi:predicted MPP superfamily phosphohydrolase
MKIRYFSDLHLEFIKDEEIKPFLNNIPQGLDDICICAGDIGNPYEQHYELFINAISKLFKKVFVIAGNHEYYGHTIEETNDFLTDFLKLFNNISFLNNSYELYEGYYFIGTTLWSNVTNPYYAIADINKIKNFDWKKYNELNKQCIKFLEDNIKDNSIIITHHLPSRKLIDKKYLHYTTIPYNQWFYCNLDNFIEKNKDNIKAWFCGHTHTSFEIKINEIPFVCNPLGYPNEKNDIDFQKVLELS